MHGGKLGYLPCDTSAIGAALKFLFEFDAIICLGSGTSVEGSGPRACGVLCKRGRPGLRPGYIKEGGIVESVLPQPSRFSFSPVPSLPSSLLWR